MRRLLAAAATAGLVIASTTGTFADPAGPGTEVDPTEPGVGVGSFDPTGFTALREEAVALVLAQDPRFAGLSDFERLDIERRTTFDMDVILGSDYYRVLPTLLTGFLRLGFIDFHYPGSWLIETTLVRDCAERYDDGGPSSDTGPWPDPCDWRHSWFYRVAPDGTVTLLFEEGDPDPMPAE